MELGKRGELVCNRMHSPWHRIQEKGGKTGTIMQMWSLLASMWQTEFYKVHKYFDGGSKLSFHFYNNINR